MEIRIHDGVGFRCIPRNVFVWADGINDEVLGAFRNYPEGPCSCIVAYNEDGDPLAVIIVTASQIVTAYLDFVWWGEVANDKRYRTPGQRLHAMLDYLYLHKRYSWLIVHDAADPYIWLEQGFTLVPPPSHDETKPAVAVLTRGPLPQPIYAQMIDMNLEWDLETHRGFNREREA